MVHRLVGEYLSAQRVESTTDTKPHNTCALVIVETRDTYWFSKVLDNAVRVCGGDRPLYIFGTRDVLLSVPEHIAARSVLLGQPLTTDTYSQLLMSPDFWNFFTEDYALIFQSDCVFRRPLRQEFFETDYIGAVCGTLAPGEFIINGGLSLRRVDAMKRAVQLLTPDDRELPEDVAFTRVMRRHGFALPTMDACNEFAIESLGNPRRAIGMHGTDKYYCAPDLIREFLE